MATADPNRWDWTTAIYDHVQLRVNPGTRATYEVALEGIRRFRG